MAMVPHLSTAIDRNAEDAEFALNCVFCFGYLALEPYQRVQLMVVPPQLRAALERHLENAELVTECAACVKHLALTQDFDNALGIRAFPKFKQGWGGGRPHHGKSTSSVQGRGGGGVAGRVGLTFDRITPVGNIE
jgi:hypothetical protein